MAYLHVSISPGRKGREYHYLRRAGCPAIRLRERPGTAAYAAEHGRALAASERHILQAQPIKRSSTFAGLCEIRRRSAGFAALSDISKSNDRFNIARLETRFGHQLHERLTDLDLRTMLHDMRETPAMANTLLKTFRNIWLSGIDAGAVSAKTPLPWVGVRLLKRAKPKRPSWDEGHMLKFCERWPLGSVPHLVVMLGYNTLQRGADLVKMGEHQRQGDAIILTQRKTGARVTLPISRALDAALNGGAAGRATFILNHKRKPYRCRADLGRDFKNWCKAAGITGMTLHSLRRGGAVRLIDLGAALDEVQAVGGWASLAQMEAYIGGRDRSAAARRAVARVDGPKFQTPSNTLPNHETIETDKAFIALAFRDLLNGSKSIAQRKSALSCEPPIAQHVHRTMTRGTARQ